MSSVRESIDRLHINSIHIFLKKAIDFMQNFGIIISFYDCGERL